MVWGSLPLRYFKIAFGGWGLFYNSMEVHGDLLVLANQDREEGLVFHLPTLVRDTKVTSPKALQPFT